jgi:hypothetical protein
MMTRRELFGSGALGAAGGWDQTLPPVDRRTLEQVVEKLDVIAAQFVDANRGCSTGACPASSKLRDAMTLFLRANGKFPDFIDVGHGVFLEMYDWHVRNQQPLVVARAPDGRYGLGYLFTRLILRPDAVPDFIGVAYDLRP